MSELRIRVRYPNGRVAYFAFSGAACLVGRAPDSDVQIRTSEVSWRHLRLQRRGDEILAEDLGSSAGTTVGDRPLLRGVVRPIDQGEPIKIGPFELTVEPADAPTEVASQVEVLDPEIVTDPRSQNLDDQGAAFGGWLSSLEGKSGVEVSVERTRVTVKNAPAVPPEDLDSSDLPTTRIASLAATAGPLDETVRIERPKFDSLEPATQDESHDDPSRRPVDKRPGAQPPSAYRGGEEPIDPTLPAIRSDADRGLEQSEGEVLRVAVPRPVDVRGGQQLDPSADPSDASSDTVDPPPSRQRPAGVPTWQMLPRQEASSEAGSRSAGSVSSHAGIRSPMRNYEDRIQHPLLPEVPLQQRENAFAQLPWGAVLKAAGSVALILGFAALVFVLLQLFG